MLPAAIARTAALCALRALGLAAALTIPGSGALAQPMAEPAAQDGSATGVRLCSLETASTGRPARLCQALAGWAVRSGRSGPVARIEIDELRADRPFWRSLPGTQQDRLMEFDAIQIVRPAALLAAEQAATAQTDALPHPDAAAAASSH
jgi:hypothetical protein